MVRHLSFTMSSKTTLFLVARELDFPADIIRLALTKSSFEDAGSLVTYLLDYSEELEEEQDSINKETECRRKEKDVLCERVEDETEHKLSSKVSPSSSVSSLRKETEYLYSLSLCLHCWKNKRNIVTLPCCHYNLCEMCAKNASKCPIRSCNADILSTIKTFLA